MDKKNTIIGLSLLFLSFGLLIYEQQEQAKQARERALNEPAETIAAPNELVPEPDIPEQGASRSPALAAEAPGMFREADVSVAPAEEAFEEKLWKLSNGVFEVTFTNVGGAIRSVDFIARDDRDVLEYPQTPAGEEPYRFNAGARTPALSLSIAGGEDELPNDFAPEFFRLEGSEKDASTIQFFYDSPEGGRIIRAYKLQESGSILDPYIIEHETNFINRSDRPLALSRVFVNAGTAPPTLGDTFGDFLNVGYRAIEDTRFLPRKDFDESSGFLGIGSRPSSSYRLIALDGLEGRGGQWIAVKNQFFASILTPIDLQADAIFAKPVALEISSTEAWQQNGITGAARFDLGTLDPGEKRLLSLQFYVGPKEYRRIASLDQPVSRNHDDVMQFGYLAGISKVLLWALVSLQDIIRHIAPTWAWGFAIILLTVLIKGALWPLTQIQVRSSKRMAELQKPMQEMREKYKDNPQKLNQAMMELWKEHKINPAAGCLPMLVQIPIFIGLYFMLRTSSDLRYAPFLWISDLSVPDTVATIAGLPINIMPLLMGASMFLQMRFTPTPTTDELQRKMFQFMPFMFLFICYNFPSGLVLYWTVQNAISIFQQWLTNRVKDEEDVKIELELAEAEKSKKRKGKPRRKS